MRVIIQRVSQASVVVKDKVFNSIGIGFLILLGVEEHDLREDADWLCKKISGLRVFNDDEGRMNLSLRDVNGEVLVISQFTLHASTRKGNRPSFVRAAHPDKAVPLYEYFNSKLSEEIKKDVKTGQFGADMKVNLVNDGPVTIIMDSKNRE